MNIYFVGCITTAEGSALVKLGNTTIMCGIKVVSTGSEFTLLHHLCPSLESFTFCRSIKYMWDMMHLSLIY